MWFHQKLIIRLFLCDIKNEPRKETPDTPLGRRKKIKQNYLGRSSCDIFKVLSFLSCETLAKPD